jgi:hypothetical protein
VLELLKNFDHNRASIDEMVSLRAFARGLVTEYIEQDVELPEWIEAQSKSLDRQILAKNHDRLEARRKELLARKDSLKTTVERKAEINAELAKLNKKLDAA